LREKCRELHRINGHFRILNWRYVSTIFLAIFSGDILKNIGLKNRPQKNGRYLHFFSVPESWPLIELLISGAEIPSGYVKIAIEHGP